MLRTWTPVVAVCLVAGLLAGCGSGGDDGRTVSNQAPNRSAARSLEPTPSPPSIGPSPPADGLSNVSFAGVSVTGGVHVVPRLTVSSSSPAPGLLVQDLLVGTGAAATPTSTAKLHYEGVLYADGTPFDSNFDVADPPDRELGKAIAGFAQGIGGTDGVTPMKVGGRRLLIFPAALGYGAVPQDIIPAHSSLVFVVDLLGLS